MRKWNVKFSWQYGSHIPVLVKALSLTDGPVLELGAGIYSTPVLHWMCAPKKRELVTYDNDSKYLDMYGIKDFQCEFHTVLCVSDWDDADIERNWGVVFVDHKPSERRKVDVARVADYADYVVIHDTDSEKHYQYSEIYSLFKYRREFRIRKRGTAILTNLRPLDELSLG